MVVFKGEKVNPTPIIDGIVREFKKNGIKFDVDRKRGELPVYVAFDKRGRRKDR